jgi:hypothetical protein
MPVYVVLSRLVPKTRGEAAFFFELGTLLNTTWGIAAEVRIESFKTLIIKRISLALAVNFTLLKDTGG